MAGAVALRLGPGAARALAGSAAGIVEPALHPGGYVRLGPEAWVLVAPGRAPSGPLSVHVRGLERSPLEPGDEVRIDTRGAGIAHAAPGGPLRDGWREALAAALGVVEPAPPELEAGLAALSGGAERAAAGRPASWRRGAERAAETMLAGRGDGLTPAGDDVLAGYAAWRHAGGSPVTLPGERCSPIGLAYLRCAERGELPDAAAGVLRAIRSGDARLAARRARTLSRWGASSGRAILWGMAAAAGAT